jgi:hypothetical protein
MNFKNVKFFLKVILSSILCLGMLTSCSQGESPREAVEKALTATKSLDEVGMSNYFSYEELVDFDGVSNEKSVGKLVGEDKEKAKLFFSKLSYNIVSSSVEKNTANVKTEITNLDMKSIMQEYFTEAFNLAMGDAFSESDKQLSQEELVKKMEQMLIDTISKQDNKTVTATVDIKLTKSEKGWKINMDKTLQDAITGGLSTISQQMNENNKTSETPKDKLLEINDYIVSDMWNKGFCDISYYMDNGKGSTGESIDIDFSLSQLDAAYKKKADYDNYLQGLDDTQFADIKNIWTKLSTETDSLYNQIKKNKPTPGKGSLDTGKFSQYMDAFQQALDSVK